MSNAVYYVSYKLKKDVSVSDFLLAAKKLNDGHISKQKGYVSWRQMLDGDTWADLITFETMDDLNNFKEVSKNPGKLAKDFYSFINFSAKGNKSHIFSVEKSY
ncbi:MAG: hypothetical protein FWE48_07140 [Coriobacteriia bacterium]|nr:hypothetical protein [Coriobacteriia bacterium]